MSERSVGIPEGHPQGLSRAVVIAWLVLVGITLLEVSLILGHIALRTRVPALILLALMKASLIGAYYMNLRFERLAMVYLALSPLILLILMLIAVVPDAALLLGRP